MTDYGRLQRQLHYTFNDIGLLQQALTHRSHGQHNNERLEFLGDALLNSTIAQLLFNQFSDEKEGILSRLRASLVKGETLAEIAREFDLGEILILGEGEMKSGGFRRDSILADSVEAIIGAIFIDGGMAACSEFIQRIYQERLDDIAVDKHLKDPKTRLQEFLQARQMPLPNYNIVDVAGESHQQQFIVECDTVLLKKNPTASASSRRQAEKMAAAKVLEYVESHQSES